MIGAIAGDVIGSVYEVMGIKTKDFPLFDKDCRVTDDTVLTVAVAEALLTDGDYVKAMKNIGRRHPDAGYGGTFYKWLMSDEAGPYNSWGNGSAMRVSPVGWALDSEEEVLKEAKRSAEVTHNHPEGIKGAQAVALAVYMARMKATKEDIRREISDRFGYDLHRSVEEIRPNYQFDVSCQGSVPEAIICFLEARNFEDAVRNGVSLGGDTDTQGSMAGAIAEAYFGGVPLQIVAETKARIPVDLLSVVVKFQETYIRK